MERKTFKVQDLKAEVNRRNQHSTCAPGVREGWNSLLVEVLARANAYSGYRFLSAEEVPAGHKPGVNESVDEPKRFEDTDNTRVFYY